MDLSFNHKLLGMSGRVSHSFGWLLLFGFVIYIAGFYFNITSKQNTLLYLLVFLPTLMMSVLSCGMIFSDKNKFILLGSLLIYFTLSGLWVDDGLKEFVVVLKYSVYLFVLMLACFF